MSAVAPLPAVVRRRSSVLLLVGLPLIAALLGALLASMVGGEKDAPPRPARTPPPRVVAAGDLRFVLPDRWTPAATGPRAPGFGDAKALFVRSWNAQVAVALLPPTSPSLLPPPLAASARRPGAPAPLVVRAGRVRAYHYALVLGNARVVDVYAAPTTRGTATITCSGILYMPAECDLAVSAVRLARGSFLPLSADAAFLEALPAVVARLNATRARLRGRLAGAATVDGGARTATRLAAAYAAADRALRPLAAARGDAPATVRTLARLRTAHAELALALRGHDRGAFERAVRAVRADETRLERALARWQRALRAFA
jgi:hypothetical protein